MKILYFAPIYYDDLKQRPQYIAEILSKNHEVWYIEPTISWMAYVLKRGRTYRGDKYDINRKLHIVRVNGTFAVHISLHAFSIFRSNISVQRKQLAKLLKECDMIWIGYCGWFDLIADITDKKIIYDKMDDDVNITQNQLIKKLISRVEPQLILKASSIFVTAKVFYKNLKTVKKNVYYVPNAYNQELMGEVYEKPNESGKKIFGYIGTIAHWFDVEAINRLLLASPQNYVVLVGPNRIPIIDHERVKYIGTIPKCEVGRYINSFDICLFPFKKSEFLDTIDPVKIYEYLALNKPVIAVDSIETRKFGNLVVRYKEYEELERISNEDLLQPFANSSKCLEFLNENSWEQRVESILKHLFSEEK